MHILSCQIESSSAEYRQLVWILFRGIFLVTYSDAILQEDHNLEKIR